METDAYIQMMKGYVEVSKTYVQLSVASLILPITFIRDILGIKDQPLAPYLNGFLIAGWTMLLLCVATGMLYQVVAARLIAQKMGGAVPMRAFPRLFFNTSITSFFIGLSLFVIGAIT